VHITGSTKGIGAAVVASLDRQEARVLALLSAAYGKAVEVLGHIARAADA
jgi:NAD(P)-dependent dehydrogenase (short-subunit alcohol dehydrogenase family)